MLIRVVAIGKLKDRGVRESVSDYYGRIGRYARFEEVELKDGSADDVSKRIEKAIPDRSRVIALEVAGKALSSAGLAKFVGRCENDGVQNVVWLIGGAYGLPPAASAKADLRLSLSALTLPHRLVRLLLAEQIYRAFTILRGEPYNH